MSFLTPLFWLGLAALAVPVLVHLVRRTRAPRVEFPTLMFVRRVPQRTIRRRRLQNLLLLVLRCLALLLLILAFARPYFRQLAASGSESAPVEVILLDRSFSMRQAGRFERARARARQLVGERRGSRWGLIIFDEGFEVVSRPTTDSAGLLARLAEAGPGDGATDYGPALRAAESLLREYAGSTRVIHLLSDLQASGITAGGAGYQAADGVRLIPENFGAGVAGNLAVTEVRATPTIFQPKYDEVLTARVTNFGDAAASGVRVELRLNGQTSESRVVNIPAAETVAVDFTGFNLNEGVNQGVIRIAGDEFTADNERFFALRRVARVRGLIIESVGRGGGRSSSLYLRNALAAGENSPFEIEVKSAGTVNPAELGGYQLIIVNDAPVSQALAGELERRVAAGMPVIMALGPRTTSAGFNPAFASLTGLTLGEQSDLRGSYVTLGETPDHPIFAPFRQSGRPPTGRIIGYRQVALAQDAAGGGRIIARFDDGAPALIETERGRGRVLLLTTTLDTTWNDLPLKPAFLPLLRQMTRYLVERELPAALTVGQTLTIKVGADGLLPAIDTPAGRRLPEFQSPRVAAEGAAPVVILTEQGFYQLRGGTEIDQLAVNTAARESDLTSLTVDELLSRLAVATTRDQPRPAETAGASEGVEEIEGRQRVWFYLLLAALLLFITEGILARRTRMARLIN
jgi:hypothetical protein